MFSRISVALFAFCSMFVLASCVNKSINVNEVLQQKLNDNVYTACNLWYDDNKNISGLNYMEGTLLPIGSKITAEKGDLYFGTMQIHDENGNTYTLKFDADYITTPPYKLIKRIFSLENPEAKINTLAPEIAAAVRDGKVIRGMTRDEVLLSWGAPNPSLTPDLRNNTWIYNISRYEVVHVLFSGDKVTRLLNINDK